MNPIEFEGTNCVYAKDQPEYLPLPVMKSGEPNGEVISCWKLNWKERLCVFLTGRFWLSIWTFHRPLQPLRPFTLWKLYRKCKPKAIRPRYWFSRWLYTDKGWVKQ